MKTQITSELFLASVEGNETIVSFHIGRGGRFHNAGHISFLGEENINYYTKGLIIIRENQYKLFSLIKGKENITNKYYECCDTDNFSFFENRLKFDMGGEYWFTPEGTFTGLKVKNDGTGRIDIDGEYDTTYSSKLCDIDEEEAKAIIEATGYRGNIIENIIEELENRYIVQDRESGNIIESFSTLEEAEKRLEEFEESDKEEGIFVPDFYEIKVNAA